VKVARHNESHWSLSKSDLVVLSVFLALGMGDNQLAVNPAVTETAEVHHSTWTRVPPFIYELLTCNADNIPIWQPF